MPSSKKTISPPAFVTLPILPPAPDESSTPTLKQKKSSMTPKPPSSSAANTAPGTGPSPPASDQSQYLAQVWCVIVPREYSRQRVARTIIEDPVFSGINRKVV